MGRVDHDHVHAFPRQGFDAFLVTGANGRAYAQAVSNTDMAPCVSISDASTRASCITQVALRVKNPSVCGNLTLQADIDICNLYAKGGEQAK